MTTGTGSRLAVMIDGASMDDDAARALWTEFSAHMDAHEGDMKGFAAKKGWFAVAPEYRQGKAVLVVRTTAAAPAAPPPPPRKPQAGHGDKPKAGSKPRGFKAAAARPGATKPATPKRSKATR
jgi:hypothetical protein